jgi:hypothetical protein
MSELIAFLMGAGLCYAATQAVQRWVGGGGRKLETELKRFFGGEVRTLPIVNRSFATVDLANLQLAIDHYVETNCARARVVGYTSLFGNFQNNLRALIGSDAFFSRTTVSAAQYREVDIDVDRQMRCVENGIHLIEGPEGRIAAHVRSDAMAKGLELEVMAVSPELATRFVEQVRARIAEANVFRGKVLSLECEADLPGRPGFSHVRFHRFPGVRREEIILPEETLEMLERNTLRFFQHADLLRRSGRSLKRGLLLHGKPGTGKTYTAKWLAQSLEDVTTILISGDQLQLVKECCQLARMLAPALVIMEDVDLIAAERDEKRHPAYQITLHQLLNEMDGLASNTEVLFLLTTNRPEAIEPAIAARPGRIDQAIEFPLPDAGCRRRLLALYGRGLVLSLEDPDRVIARTEGASPAFIQELVRKAALVAAEEGAAPDGSLHVSDACFDTALREMIYGGGELTRQLLGFAPDPHEPQDRASG